MSLKERLIIECVKTQEKVAKNAQDAAVEAQQMANEYGAPKDRYDSFRMQQLRKKDLFLEQYQKALLEIETLKKINPEKKIQIIGFGSVVFTDKQNIFISTGIGKIKIEETDFFCISLSVPLAKAFTGKQKNDTINFNNQLFRIIDCF